MGISGVVIDSALSKGSRSGPEAFRAGHFEDLKPETVHEKHLAPRVFLKCLKQKSLPYKSDGCNKRTRTGYRPDFKCTWSEAVKLYKDSVLNA